MSEFLKFAYELLSQVVYNIVSWVTAFLKLFFLGWMDYFTIFRTYFPTLSIFAKILSVLLMLILAIIPLLILWIVIRKAILRHQLKVDNSDNAALYKEIGRLNKQVLTLMDEKNSILALKVNAMGGTERIPYMGASALTDDVLPTVGAVTDPGKAMQAQANAISAGLKEAAAAAAASGDASKAPIVQAVLAEKKGNIPHRFPKLTLVDEKYENYEYPVYDNEVTLEQFAQRYRLFAASQMGL